MEKEHPTNADIMKALKDLKEQVTPVVEFYQNMSFSVKALLYVLGFITVAATAIGAIYAGIKYLK